MFCTDINDNKGMTKYIKIKVIKLLNISNLLLDLSICKKSYDSIIVVQKTYRYKSNIIKLLNVK